MIPLASLATTAVNKARTALASSITPMVCNAFIGEPSHVRPPECIDMDQPPAMALRGAVLYATGTIFRTGRLLAPSTPVISPAFAFPARPPQPS
jgi:hypothetical protein